MANPVEPDTGQDERAISTFSFDLTLIQAQCLNDSLKEQFDYGVMRHSNAGHHHFYTRPKFARKITRQVESAIRIMAQ